MENKELMKVSNIIINQPLLISARQFDIIMYIGYLLQKKQTNITDDKFIELSVSKKEIKEMLSLNEKIGSIYIDKLFSDLREKNIIYSEDDYSLNVSLISVYERKEDNIIIFIYEEMARLFVELRNKYTIADFNAITHLSSIYSKRIYLLILQYRNLDNKREFSIDILKSILGADVKYKLFQNFKIRVLETAKKEINKAIPQLKFNYELIRNGRDYERVLFTFDFSFIKELPQPQQEQAEISNNQYSEETQKQEEQIIKPSQYTKPVENKDQHFKSYQEKAEEYKKNVLEKLTADYIYGWCAGKGIVINAEKFLAHYESFGWCGPDGRYIMNWQSLVKSWELRHTPEQREDAFKALQKWESEYASRDIYNKLKEAGIDNKDFAAEMHSKNLEYLFNYEEKRFYTEEELDRDYSYPEKCFYNRWGYMLDLI